MHIERCLLINPPCPYSEAPIIPLGLAYTAASDQPTDALAVSLAEAALYPLDHVRERLESWVGRGLLKYTNNGNHVWSWASRQRWHVPASRSLESKIRNATALSPARR